MRCKAQSTAMPIGIASICNAAGRPYRMDSTNPISVIQWTRPALLRLVARVHREPTPKLQAAAEKVTKATAVELRMMRAMRPLSAP